MSSGISAQGTIVARNGTTIAELKDITPPSLSRNPIETTTHSDTYDAFVVGIKRRGELGLKLNFLPSGDATQNAVAGLHKAFTDGTLDLYKITFPDNAYWQFSGYVVNISPTAPVDTGLEATVSIRPTGGMIIFPSA